MGDVEQAGLGLPEHERERERGGEGLERRQGERVLA